VALTILGLSGAVSMILPQRSTSTASSWRPPETTHEDGTLRTQLPKRDYGLVRALIHMHNES
jgi:hypothetical protein